MLSRVSISITAVALLLLSAIGASAQSPSLTVSPPPGPYATTQTFDLMIIEDLLGHSVLDRTITLDGADVTELVLACARVGALPNGAVTRRCPNFSSTLPLGPGLHTFKVLVLLSGGATMEGGAVWEILAAAGP